MGVRFWHGEWGGVGPPLRAWEQMVDQMASVLPSFLFFISSFMN